MPDTDGDDDAADTTEAIDAIRRHRDTTDALRRVLKSLTAVGQDIRQIEFDVLEMIEQELWEMSRVIDRLDDQEDTDA